MISIRCGTIGALCFLLSMYPTVGLAGFQPTAQQRSACMGDALSLCRAVIPDVDRITACLAAKKSQLSPQCRAQFDKP